MKLERGKLTVRDAVCLLGVIVVFVCLLLPAVQGPRRGRRSPCKNNLKQIGLALHNYHDKYGSLPPAYIADENGKPMHSWRVLLLPFLDLQSLYQKYRFDEPWDGPNNIKLLDEFPDAFRCPNETKKNGRLRTTSYVAVVGDETIWPNQQSTRLEDITSQDGSTYTIAVVEIANSTISWTEPRDLVFDDLKFSFEHGTEISSQHPNGAHVVFVDGSVRYISNDIDPEKLRGLLTIDGGETIGDF